MTTVHEPLEVLKGRWSVLVFAPSQRAPAYEQQMRLFGAEPLPEGVRRYALVQILGDGEAMSAEIALDPASASALRTRFGLGKDQYALVLVDPAGVEQYRTTAPVQPSMLLARLSGTTAEPTTGRK